MSNNQNANKDKVVFVKTSIVLPGDTLLENLYNPLTGERRLCVSKQGSFEVVNEYRDKVTSTVYRPHIDNVVKAGFLLLPSEATACQLQPLELLKEVRAFIHRYVDLIPGFEAIAARYVMMTWVFDGFEKVPFLRILGHFGTGKSRFLDVMAAICGHSLRLGSSVTSANIYRTLDKYPGASAVFDEANFDNSTRKSNIVQMLNDSYARTGGIFRCEERSWDPNLYLTFGPKIFAANGTYDDEALESRIISQTAYQSRRQDIPKKLPRFSAWQEAQDLRNKLFAFRLAFLQLVEQNPEPEMPDDFDPRFQEILAPLFQTTGEEVIPPDILRFLKELNYQRSISNLQTEEAYAVNIMDEKRKLGEHSMSVGLLAKELYDRHGLTLTARKVGGLVRTLGIPLKARSSSGISIDLRSPKIEELAKRYRLPEHLN